MHTSFTRNSKLKTAGVDNRQEKEEVEASALRLTFEKIEVASLSSTVCRANS